METLTTLADKGLAGALVLAIAAMVYIVVKFLQYLKDSEERHIKSYTELSKAIRKNTSVTDETYKYLKMRNGSLEKIIKESKK